MSDGLGVGLKKQQGVPSRYRTSSKVPSNKFKMYAGFNGEFRRKPVVSIRGVGASKKETKEDLVKRLKEERAEREVSYFQHL